MKSCNSCGKCCLKYGAQDLAVTDEEIEHWQIFHPQIASYVKNNKLWFDPDTGEALTRCPWLIEKEHNLYHCAIYLARPEDCRFYPTTIREMLADECEMIEPNDLQNPKLAQKKLDILMQDSRPSLSSDGL